MDGEGALLRAVRDQIILHSDFVARQCEIEFEELAPSMANDVFIMVQPGGVTAGATQTRNPRASDYIYGIDVSIALRAPKKPRDRLFDLMVATTGSMEIYTTSIKTQIDFDYDVTAAANTILETDQGSGAADFIEPLVFSSMGPIRRASADIFAQVSGEAIPALVRRIQFRGARRINTANRVQA